MEPRSGKTYGQKIAAELGHSPRSVYSTQTVKAALDRLARTLGHQVKPNHREAAAACGVSEDTVYKWLNGHTRGPRGDQLRAICSTLEDRGYLIAGRDTVLPPVTGCPEMDWPEDWHGALEEAAWQVARWRRPEVFPGDVEPKWKETCTRLSDLAMLAGEHEVGRAAKILLACGMIKLGPDNCFTLGCQKSVSDLEEIRTSLATPGLVALASIVEGRLLREMVGSVDDPVQRAYWFCRSAALLAAVRREYPLPYALLVPGLLTDADGGDAFLIPKKDCDPLSTRVLRPIRYQAVFPGDAAFNQWLACPADRSSIERFLAAAEAATNEALAKNWADDFSRLEFRIVDLINKFLRYAFVGRAPSGTALRKERLIVEIAKIQTDIESSSKLGDYWSNSFGATILALECFIRESNVSRRCQRLRDEVLPRIQTCIELRPAIQSIMPQEILFHHLIMRDDRELAAEMASLCRHSALAQQLYEHYWADDSK